MLGILRLAPTGRATCRSFRIRGAPDLARGKPAAGEFSRKARRHYTKAFERYALELGRLMTIQDVAQHLGVSWDTIKDIQKRDLQRRF